MINANLNLATEFNKLFDESNHQKRGTDFQRLLCRLLVQNGFDVWPNARSATPRQTDMVARKRERHFLVEAKWMSKKIHSSEIDDLRNRLIRTPHDFVGCIFSMSDYAETATTQVTENRQREILLFDAYEISLLFNKNEKLDELIDRKRDALRLNAHVLFLRPKSSAEGIDETPLPNKTETLVTASGEKSSIFCQTENYETIYCREIPDIGWSILGGNGVALLLHLHPQTIADLRKLFGLIHRLFPLSSKGSFSIRQMFHCWHGIGLNEFLAETSCWRERYETVKIDNPHHSEELAYFDSFDYGFLTLTGRQRVGDVSFLHGVELELRMSGTPVDMSKFKELCEATGNSLAVFSHLESTGYDEIQIHPPIPLERVAEIHSKEFGSDSVSGLVVKNPFYKNRKKLPVSEKQRSILLMLDATELLVCFMSDWHNVGDVMDRYELWRIEGTWTANVHAFRPICTWNECVHKVPDEKSLRANLQSFLSDLADAESGHMAEQEERKAPGKAKNDKPKKRRK